MSTRRFSSRRRFLRGLGGFAATPLLGGLLSSAARAATGDHPLRFCLVFTGNGQHPEHWLPLGSGADFSLSPVLEPLAAHQSKLLLLRGFAGEGSHSVGMSETTTGRPSTDGEGVPTGGPSIDQLLADAWHGETPLHSLELGVMPANESFDQIVYSAGGLPVPAIGSARGAFERVFGVTNADPAQVAARRSRRRSVLDVVAKDLASLEARLPAASRRLLDEQLTLVRELEKDLEKPFVPTACDLPEPAPGAEMVSTWTAHNNTLAAAFRCDAVRVATMRIGGWGGIESGGYTEIGIGAGHHDVAHGGSDDPYNNLLAINRFHAQQVASLAASLDAVPEGDCTLLDNTVLVWVNEFGLGDFNHHGREDIHITLLGGASAGMANGVYRQTPGTDYAHFLFTLAHLMGQTSITQFGDRGNQIVPELFA
jgi:hypothetical protein